MPEQPSSFGAAVVRVALFVGVEEASQDHDDVIAVNELAVIDVPSR